MQNRLRHLLTIWRGVSRRDAMTSLASPVAARSTIFARITSRYGDVYRRARAASASRSASVNWTRYGLVLGMRTDQGAEDRHGDQQLAPVTVSAGVAAAPEHGSTATDLLRAADNALYAAKQGGRDRVVVYQATQPSFGQP
jgi:GGDEF domain-containing protein